MKKLVHHHLVQNFFLELLLQWQVFQVCFGLMLMIYKQKMFTLTKFNSSNFWLRFQGVLKTLVEKNLKNGSSNLRIQKIRNYTLIFQDK